MQVGRRRALRWIVGTVVVLFLLVSAASACALALSDAGAPAHGTVSRGQDALWMGHAWVDGRKTPADAARLAASLRGTGVHDLYLHVGPLDDRGVLDPALRPRAVVEVRALHTALPGARRAEKRIEHVR